MNKKVNKINVETRELLRPGEEYLLHLKIVGINRNYLEACLISSAKFNRLYS